MFRIKICGMTNVDDARMAAEAGADAVGLNFFASSRRYVEPQSAGRIAAALPAGVMKVGVFVYHESAEIRRIVDDVGLDCVQLHGDETASLLGELPADVKIVRAHRCGARALGPLVDYLDECRELGRLPDAVLLDADAGTDFGGTGRVVDWAVVGQQQAMLAGLPMILAGGLTPENVAAGIEALRPSGVDVASGVESAPGRKDARLVARFVAEARNAFARI